MTHKLLYAAILTIFSAIPGSATENLLTLNPNFAEGKTGWEPVDGTTYWLIKPQSFEPEDEKGGSLCRVIFIGTRSGSKFTVWNKQEIPVKPEKTYTVGAAFLSLTHVPVYSQSVVVKVFDTYGEEVTVLESDPVIASNAFSNYPFDFVMPDGAYVKIGLRVTVNEKPSELAYLYFTNVYIEEN